MHMLAWWSMRVGPGDLTINGTGPGRHRPALKKGLEAQTLCCLSWSWGCQSLEDPSSSQLPEHLNCPSIHKAHRQGKIGSIFFLSTFCLSIDRADGNLVSQLPYVPIWSEYIWKEIIWMHLLFKNENENGRGVGGRLSIFFFPLPAPSISFPKTNKEINSYNIKSQQALLLLPSPISK